MRNDKYFVCCRDGFSPSFLPQVGMKFSSTEKAWIFWLSYGGQQGFDVRKKGTQIKGNLMERLGHADLFVRTKVTA
jgi:hypothetical protein